MDFISSPSLVLGECMSAIPISAAMSRMQMRRCPRRRGGCLWDSFGIDPFIVNLFFQKSVLLPIPPCMQLINLDLENDE